MKVTNDWKPITHLVDVGLWNDNGLLWELRVNRWTSEERKAIRGMPIGFIDGDGFHGNPKDKDKIYLMIFTTKGKIMFFEKNRHLDELQKSI